jgi:regulator of nucleoside diphosphate kinase
MNRPDISVARRDLGPLDALLGAAGSRLGKAGAFLLDEITRARIVRDHEIMPTLVTMGATVRFRDEESGRESVVRLVYPHEIRTCDRGVSVLTPVGAALLGLSEGQSIDYETVDGRVKTITVLKVIGSAPGGAAHGFPELEIAPGLAAAGARGVTCGA